MMLAATGWPWSRRARTHPNGVGRTARTHSLVGCRGVPLEPSTLGRLLSGHPELFLPKARQMRRLGGSVLGPLRCAVGSVRSTSGELGDLGRRPGPDTGLRHRFGGRDGEPFRDLGRSYGVLPGEK
jgi:hypothetical protein